MTDFLDELERELIGAARRRTLAQRGPTGSTRARRRGAALLTDLRAIGSGAAAAASPGVVAIIVAIVLTAAAQHAARHVGAAAGRGGAGGQTAISPDGQPASGATPPTSAVVLHPCQGTVRLVRSDLVADRARSLLAADRIAPAGTRQAAVSALAAALGSRTVVVDVRWMRVTRLPGGAPVVLLLAGLCPPGHPTAHAGLRTVVLAEVRVRGALRTVQLGTPGRIDSGAAARAAIRAARAGRSPLASGVVMVPLGVWAIVCRAAGSGATRRIVVVDHLVRLPRLAATARCSMIGRHGEVLDA